MAALAATGAVLDSTEKVIGWAEGLCLIARRAASRLFLLSTFLLGSLYPSGRAESQQVIAGPPQVAKGRVIVELPPQTISGGAVSALRKPGLAAAAISPLGTSGNIALVQLTAPSGVAVTMSTPEVGFLTDEEERCEEILAAGLAVRCSPDFVVSTALAPNDPDYAEQATYALDLIDAEAAWEVRTDASNVVVAVIDSGVEYTHPDLAANMWVNPGEIAANGIDDDANGYIDDVHGINAITNTGDPMDDNFHGTHCAGTIGAVGNNGIGVTGVAWQARIMALKFLSAGGFGYSSDAIQVIDYAIMMKERGVPLRILSNSWGGGGHSSVVNAAVQRARDAGLIFIAAAGNDATNNDFQPFYPANYPGVVSVASTNFVDDLSGFSQYGGSTVHIGAPGSFILSTSLDGGYTYSSGTSMATPHVAGALALLLTHRPALTAAEAIAELYDTGDPLQTLAGVTTTGRRINVANLLQGVKPPEPGYQLCEYTTASIPFAPPTAVSSAPRVIPVPGVDVWPEHAVVALPFAFPFYEASYASISIGQNGIVYLRDPADPYPWVTHLASFASPYAIFPLHTSLYDYFMNTVTDPEVPGARGVRVHSQSSRVDIEWVMDLAVDRSLGRIQVILSLFPDGRIEQFTSIPSTQLGWHIRNGSIVGIRGGGVDDAVIVSHHGFPFVMYQNQGLAYTRGDCTVSEVVPTPTPVPSHTPTLTPTVTPTLTPTRIPTVVATMTPTVTPTPYPTYPVPTATPPTPAVTVMSVRLENPRRVRKKVTRGQLFRLIAESSGSGLSGLSFRLNNISCGASLPFALSSSTTSVRGTFPRLSRSFRTVTVTLGGAATTANITGRGAGSPSHTLACAQLRDALTRMRPG